ncbi:putative transmembrane protein TauE [Helianthus anomalus]
MTTKSFVLYLVACSSAAVLTAVLISGHDSHKNNHLINRHSPNSGILNSDDKTWPELVFNWRIVLATLIGFLGSAFGTVGGGGIFVPMLTLVVGFDTKSAAALSKCMIMGASASSFWYNLRVQHPCREVPILDYDLALLFQPMLMLGITLGVALSVVFPYWLITVVATPESVEAWVRLLLLPRCTLQIFRPSNRQERRSGNMKSLQCLSIQRALAAWGNGDGFAELILSLFAELSEVVTRPNEPPNGSNNSRVGTNVKQCLRKVAGGHFTAAVKVLCSSGVAPLGENTMKALVAKHPVLPPPVMLGSLLSEPPLIVDVDNVLGCIKSFPKGTLL